MTAEIVSVGTELLLGQIVDTHAVTMAKLLAECGIGCNRRATVGDNFERVVSLLTETLARTDVVITIGGLGPTEDDITRDAIAAAMGDELVVEPEIEARLRAFFYSRHLPWLEAIGRQACRPKSARLIDNPNGTAPGLLCQKNDKTVIALPGPKGEFEPMAMGPVKDFLRTLQQGIVIHSRVLRICGLGESEVESRVLDLMHGENPTVAPYAHLGEVHLRITARAPSEDEADKLIDPVEKQIRETLQDNVFGTDNTTLEQATVDLALLRGVTIGVAESMTGGVLGGRLTSVDGASSAFLGGVICYDPDVKECVVGVRRQTLDAHGPVSAEVAIELAQGVRRLLKSDYGVSITGNAGPTSDVDGKPVGLVYVGVAGPKESQVYEVSFRGSREDIRTRASQFALVKLREELLKLR